MAPSTRSDNNNNNNNNNSMDTREEISESVLSPIFSSNDADSDHDNDNTNKEPSLPSFDFTDKVRCLHEHFDTNQDGYLNFVESAALQKATEGNTLTSDMYAMACKALDCNPTKGISLDALRLTYASDGANVDKDFEKVFSKLKKQQETTATKQSGKEKEEKDKEEIIYEIGDDGVDISS